MERILGGKITRHGLPHHVGISLRVYSNARDLIVAAAAKLERVLERRINHEWLARVLVAYLEAYAPLSFHHVTACDVMLDAVGLLINERLLLSKIARRRVSNQRPFAINGEPARAPHIKHDGSGISSTSQFQVVFESMRVAVVNQVHSLIQALVFHLAVVSNVGAPLLRIIAAQVVGCAGELLEAGNN